MPAARVAVSLVFLFHGILVASWLSRIPAIQERLGLGVGQLGVALLASAVGALISMPLTAVLVARFSSRRVCMLSSLALCGALPCLAWAPSTPAFVLALLQFGAVAGIMDVAMNTQASAVEQGSGKPVMSSFHALFSLGGMAGAALGGWAAQTWLPTQHLPVVGLLSLVPLWLANRPLLPDEAHSSGHSSPFALPPRALLPIGLVAFCILLGEGAMADWTAIYLSRELGATPTAAAAGYAVFSVAMAVGRFLGDSLRAWQGPVRVVRAGALLAAFGLSVALLARHTPQVWMGLACVGLGYSSIFPIACSAAGRHPQVPAATGIAAVSTCGYLGFLLGPPLIGLASEHLTLRGGLSLVVCLSLVAAALAAAVRVGWEEPQRTLP